MSRRKIKPDKDLTCKQRRQKKIDRKAKQLRESRTRAILRRRDELTQGKLIDVLKDDEMEPEIIPALLEEEDAEGEI